MYTRVLPINFTLSDVAEAQSGWPPDDEYLEEAQSRWPPDDEYLEEARSPIVGTVSERSGGVPGRIRIR